jgi:1-acyl-sn-glycerol-3-phosphate acyltransferase
MKLICTFRSFIGVILFIVTTGILAALGIILNVLFNRRKFDNWIISTWSRLACFYFNVDVKVFGEENNIRGQGAVLLFNHSSFMDIFAMGGYLYNIRWGAKIELFKIPVFGYCMRRFGILPIARDNREEVFRVYEEAKVRFARGEKFGLSPEGG